MVQTGPAEEVPRFPRVDETRWRVDVTLSSSSLTRSMRPSVLMQLSMSDGSVRTFEVAGDKFHGLRYSIAKVLHDVRLD